MRKQTVTWHVHTNGRSHAFLEGSRLSVCGSVKLDRAPVPAPLTYPCCNCVRYTGGPRSSVNPYSPYIHLTGPSS